MGKKDKESNRGEGEARREPATASKASSRKQQSAESNGVAPPVPEHPDCAVVGVGASAGGLDAFKHFFIATRADTGMAFVLIQHLDPTHESLTAELLGKHTRMSVVQVVDEMRIEPNHVYVIPPNKYLTISGQTLQLTEPVQRRGVRVPIDFFFRSLADDQQERAIGIILSGTGSDGTLGAREIKAAGGMVMVQDPDSAQYDGMPRSAIAAGVADYVLPVEKMPEMLVGYVQHWYVHGAVASPPVAEKAPDDLATILGLLRARVKYDFSCYKKGTLTRRIQRRMGLQHIAEMGEYLARLRQDKEEVTALYKDLLIGVTNFFREGEAWQVLEKQVIDPLVDEHDADAPIRVWVAGCATGEEPYSLAMVLTERLQQANKGCGLTIFASDIDQDALAFARAGVYPENIADDVTPERLRRFFTKGEHTWRINKEIREAVVFAEHNVVSDPPFSKLDLVSCRNLLIYLEPEVQKRILGMFHFALHDGGYLFLGNAETNTQQQDLFESVSRKWRIYRRIRVSRREFEMPATSSRQARTVHELPPTVMETRRHRLPAAAQQAVMQRFVPACVMVNRQLEVCYLLGPVDDYLQLPSGEQTHDLIAMARQGLRTKLRVAVQQAIEDNKPVTLDDVRVRRGQQFIPVRVTIEPLRQPDMLAGLVLVAFDEASVEQRVRVIYVEPSEPVPSDKPESAAEYQSVIRQLERELAEAREDLKTSIEQLETSNEEFKAAHEEVTSINEELQSTNEELETSKEELQSLNEELQTVNSQLESKVSELEATNNDLHNLLASIDHATLFLDRQFRIRRFTSATMHLLPLIETDIGRPFGDFAKNFTDEDLLADAERVLKQLTPIDKEIQDQQDRWYVRRIVPYRTEDDRIDGVVVTFIEITERKRTEAKLNALNESLEQQVGERTELLQLVHDITAVANQARTVEEALRYAVERIGHYNGWQAGHVYTRAEDGSADLVPTNIWYVAEGIDLSRLKQVTLESRFQMSDQSMICDVIHKAELQWIEDIATSGNYPRNHSVDLGKLEVRAAIAFPLFVEQRIEAVLAFYSQVPIARDERFVKAMQNVGIQLGYVLQRKESDRQMAQLTLAERQRLGRELHDTLGQQMSALGMLAAALRDELAGNSSSGSVELLDKLESHVQQSQRQIRSLMVGLFPVDVEGGGLPAALERLANEMAQSTSLSCHFECEDQISLADRFTATQLFLIASEAVHNAAKHAHATKVVIHLAEKEGIRVTVTDNGIGLPPGAERSSGMGLRIMRHRAALIEAELHLESPPQGGTIVSCFLQQGQ
jgi:two-component system CheB/CheR fusion protein